MSCPTRSGPENVRPTVAMHRYTERHPRNRFADRVPQSHPPLIARRADRPCPSEWRLRALPFFEEVDAGKRDWSARRRVRIGRRPFRNNTGAVRRCRCEVRPQHIEGGSSRLHLAPFKPDRVVAEAADRARVMRDEQDRASLRLRRRQRRKAFLTEGSIPDGKHLVDDEDVRFNREGNRKPKTHVHAR